VKFDAARIYLYRHSDGYPAECGGAIVEALAYAARFKYNAGPMFAARLLGLRYDKRAHDDEPRPIYEMTGDLHGDIEHVYEVKFNAAGVPKIRHAERGPGFPDVDAWANDGKPLPLAGFVAIVNADRAAINARIAELEKENPRYVDADRYAMLSA
jgi:hypothetical protein